MTSGRSPTWLPVQQDCDPAVRSALAGQCALDQFEALHQSGQSPMCLFPTHKSCEQFDNQMLARLESGTVEVLCSDEIDETSTRVCL